jgi:hypothetical protein
MPKEITDAAIDRTTPHRDHARLRIDGLVIAGRLREWSSPFEHLAFCPERIPEASRLKTIP